MWQQGYGFVDYTVTGTATCQSPQVETIIGYVQSALNSACDVVLTVLPITILWRLQMPLGQKVGLGAVLTLSIFALAASIAKAIAIKNLDVGDLTWYMVQFQVWVIVENNTVCVAASIPSLRPLLRRKGATSTATPNYGLSDKHVRSHSRDPYGISRRTGGNAMASQHHDDNSEEHILASLSAPSEQITKTVDFVVTTEDCHVVGQDGTSDRAQGQQLPGFLRDSQRSQ